MGRITKRTPFDSSSSHRPRPSVRRPRILFRSSRVAAAAACVSALAWRCITSPLPSGFCVPPACLPAPACCMADDGASLLSTPKHSRAIQEEILCPNLGSLFDPPSNPVVLLNLTPWSKLVPTFRQTSGKKSKLSLPLHFSYTHAC